MKKMPILTFYTRNGCHLCEHAKEIIVDLQKEYEFQYEERDIEQKEEWTEMYGLMIPVVMINEKEIQYGHIDKGTLKSALEN